MKTTTTRVSKEVRESAINRFKRYHGNHTHHVCVSLDLMALKINLDRYRDRLDKRYVEMIESNLLKEIEK